MKADEFRPEIRLIEGRAPKSGTQELIVGAAAASKFKNLSIGDAVFLRGTSWPIVGKFNAGGSLRDSELIGDVETLMAAHQRDSYNAAYVQLVSASAFNTFRDALNANPTLTVNVMRESEYYKLQSQPIADAWHFVAYIASGIMALGATFGAANTMYSAISARSREIATLRAIGFKGAGVAGSVLVEVTALAIVGALIAASIVWSIFDGAIFSTHVGAGRVVAQLSLDAKLVLLGVGWACGIGIAGGILPAIRAATAPVAVALRDLQFLTVPPRTRCVAIE